MKHCINCKQTVEPRRSNFSVLGFVVLTILGLIPGLFYLAYHFLLKKLVCPMCSSTNWGVKK